MAVEPPRVKTLASSLCDEAVPSDPKADELVSGQVFVDADLDI